LREMGQRISNRVSIGGGVQFVVRRRRVEPTYRQI